MTLFFITTLGVSIVGMASLLMLKRWEVESGRVLGGRARPAIGAAAHTMLVWAEEMLPSILRRAYATALLVVRTLFHRLSALLVVLTERGLERTLRLLRRSTAVPRNDENASAFLREVSAHKAQLLRESRKRGTIYEE